MAKVFITGGAGLIGSHTASELASRGHAVTIYDSFQQYVVPHGATFFENLQYRYSRLLANAHIVRGSTDDKDYLRRTLDEVAPEYVIHLSALPLAKLSARVPEEALRSIVQGTTNLLDALRGITTVRKVAYVSSSLVYGDFHTSPQREDASKQPVDLYGALKLSAEILVRTYGELYGLPYVIVRPSAVYGPSDNNQRVVQIFVERAIQRLPIKVYKPESTRLDFTYVTDIARGLCLATLTPDVLGEDFNITFGKGRTLAELVGIVRRNVSDMGDTLIETSNSADGLTRAVRGTLDTDKARRLLGYEPMFSLEDGVASYVDFIRTTNHSLRHL